MKIITDIDKMNVYARVMKKQGKTIGFVPTMGYLHGGHESLIYAARKQTDVVVVSIFVNPLQFGPQEDYESYPRDPARDEEILKRSDVDVLFYPSREAMYPPGYATSVTVEGITDTLCGASRPGHFRGVTTVVAKLLGIVKPDIAYFGQKDAQQALVIQRMVKDLSMEAMIKVLPTVREPDGLAVSSRNVFLNEKERKEAVCLYEGIQKASELYAGGERTAARIIRSVEDVLRARPSLDIEYVRIVDTGGLADVETIVDRALLAMAVRVGKTRLIDNIILEGIHGE